MKRAPHEPQSRERPNRVRLAQTLARVSEEADFSCDRAGWIAGLGGHADWWQDRANRYSAAATRLQAAGQWYR